MRPKVKPTKKPLYIRLNLYLPLISAIILICFLTVTSVIYIQKETIHQTKYQVPQQFSHFMEEKIRHEAATLGEYIALIQQDDEIADFFRARDKQHLFAAVESIYQSLNEKIELTHMYFIEPNGKVLLRVHDFARDGDVVDRRTFIESRKRQDLFYGLEFGLKKNYTLRVVTPWIVDGKIIGYFELGKEIDKIIHEYASLLKTHVYIAVKKKVFDDAPLFVKGKLKQSVKAESHYIVYSTYDIPDQVASIIDGTAVGTDIHFNGRDYFVTTMRLSDISDQDLGILIFLSDVSLEQSVIYGSIKAFTAILIIVSALFLIVGMTLLRRKEESINALTTELNLQKEALELFNIKLQNLFDLQKNIVILTDGETLQMANQAMFDFFGFENLDEFHEHYRSISERFIENKNFFHLGKVPKGKNWVETIKTLSGEKRMVAMIDQELNTQVFTVSVSEFDIDNYIVSFSDISTTVMEQMKLMRKVTHDKLTGAFNREFMEHNINQIIKEAIPKHLGVILCDIDHFKQVNDTYGHSRGDVVLKQFVTTVQLSIRNEDYLIRWGGEEFIVLMKVESAESLHKAAEHIRLSVEETNFDEVGKVTSSFGITLHREEEAIETSIERADSALYQAKEEGRNRVVLF